MTTLHIDVKDTLLELVCPLEGIPLVSKTHFTELKSKVLQIIDVDEFHLEREVLKASIKVSELHDLLQQEAELLFQYKNLLTKVENVWTSFFKRKLTDKQYAKYGRQNETLTLAEVKMAVSMRLEVKQLKLSVDRLSRVLKYIEDQINIMQYSYSKALGDSMRYRVFLEGSAMV